MITWETIARKDGDGATTLLTLPKWDTFKPENVIPELKEILREARATATRIAEMTDPRFEDVVLPFEDIDRRLAECIGPVHHLKSVMQKSYPSLKEIESEATLLVSGYHAERSTDEGLYRAYLHVKNSPSFALLSSDAQYLVERTLRDFTIAGVALPKKEKEMLKAAHEEGAQLATQFANNEQDAIDAWDYIETDKKKLEGIPLSDVARMREAAKSKNIDGWCITLREPDVHAVLSHATNRDLRAHIYDAYVTLSSEFSENGKNDNTALTRALILNSAHIAWILGYTSYAELSLKDKMAGSVGTSGVREFLDALLRHAQPVARKEYAAMEDYAKSALGIPHMEPWDFSFTEERMRQENFTLDTEEVRAYFPLQEVMHGLSEIIGRLFGLRLKQSTSASVWHPDVVFYDVYDSRDEYCGGFYADLFAREGKRGGAWMDTLSLSMETRLGSLRPVAYLNCNIRPREEGHDAYLTHGDVETLFHEFGHTLHHVAGGSVYRDLSMEGVEWDTIELPSQFMENWTWDKEALRLLSRHKETHEKIPDELVARMTSARYFNAGLFAVRQLLFARYDWDLHTQSVDACTLDPIAYWHELSRTIDVRPPYARNRFPNKFGHIFGGGYTAGYYSYMWALGLAADSFALFEERGNIFDRTIGETFMTEIIRPGSSRPMAESFLAFRARPLDPNALLRHLGLS